ncbi:MAG: hypothetical protein AAF789_14285 [Bacteroidota bacterium]
MEFDQIQHIWDQQNGERMFAINESELKRQISQKKHNINRKINWLEISLILINSACALIFAYNAVFKGENWDIFPAIFMLFSIGFLLMLRKRRLRQEQTFDRSMLGELDHAIANSQSLLCISSTMITYYLFPIACYSIISMAYQQASFEKWGIVLGLFVLAFFLIRLEKKHIHQPRKKRLIALRKKIKE